jgi:diguanylate cyclase (GGDEF)-like protein
MRWRAIVMGHPLGTTFYSTPSGVPGVVAQRAAPVVHEGHLPTTISVDPSYWPRATGLRVVIAVCYFLLIPAGLLPMSTVWWMISGGGLLVYSIAVFAACLRWRDRTWLHSTLSPYIDTVLVTFAIIALARPDYPIWVGYLLIISSLSAVQSTRYVLGFSVWTIAWFWFGVWILDASGRADVSWQLSGVVSIMAIFTAINSDVISTSNRRLQGMVHKASMTDPLTGLANRRRFREILEMHHTPDTRPLAVLMYDLDNFKQLNEEFGHVHADKVLVRVCHELKGCFREADAVARYGGDELVVLAHVASPDDARMLAERSLKLVKENVGVGLSIGVAVYPLTSISLDGAVTAADHALGSAKRGGKARVVVAPPQANAA